MDVRGFAETGARALFCAIIGLPASDGLAADWSKATQPTQGPPRSIGQTNNGCVAGAHALPVNGEGYAVMHLERRRYFGHPDLVESIESLGRQVAQRRFGPLLVGDMSQPRGGPMPSGHRSHQTGMDVDIWFGLDPSLLARTDAKRANVMAPSMLNAAKGWLDHRQWTGKQASLLELAARLPAADRIFVNPHIKRELCRTADGERQWLHKIRPWYHHDDHFHLRLACPAGSPECEAQEPMPAGDGCDASLDWWFEPHPPSPAQPPAPPPPMPEPCRALLP